MMSSQDKKEVVAVLHVKWSGVDRPLKMELQVVLQRWLIRNHVGAACTVLSASTDGRVVVKITPARALCELLKLRGRTLTINNDTTVTLISVSLTKTELETQRPDDASLDLPPSLWSEPHVEGQLGKQRGDMFSCTCDIPMHHFWYVNQAYKEEIKRIEKESGVKITAEVKLTFEAKQKDASPNNAFSEFINLVQKCSGEARGFTVPLKKMNPEEWKDTLNIIQRPENKLVLTLSSEEMTVCGPRESQDIIRKSLNKEMTVCGPRESQDIIRKSLNKEMTVCGPRQSQDAIRRSLDARTSISTSVGESTRASQDTLPRIGMSIKDPLINARLPMEENHWRLMTTSHNVQNKEEVEVTLSVIWSGGAQPQKSKVELDKVLQNWINNNDKFKGDCKVLNVSEDGSAVISLTPPPALTELQTLSGQSLSTRDGKTVKIKSVSLTPSELKTQTPASVSLPPSSISDQVQPGQQGGAVSTAGQETCTVPVGHFWYVASHGQSANSRSNTAAPTGGGATAGDGEEEKCPICMDKFTKKTQLKCKCEFCEECLAQSKKSMGPICPVCREVFGMMEGDQPDGHMTWRSNSYSLPGFPGCGTINIDYNISGGVQKEKHPNPGKYYCGIHRTAYLPDNKEGREVLRLLKKAFDQKLIFTVGTSRTTGIENQVIWNDIHHKTNISGGPQCFGYPDPDYLSRVKEELKAKGIE